MATFAPPPGTADIFADEARRWRNLENTAAAVFSRYGYGELRTPVFEYTEVFQKGLGNETEVVQKEMYTFEDKGGRSITLKPEGTAGAMRAYLERNMYANPAPTKLYYVTQAFRYEKPQSGRLRQHHQFGVEFVGSKSPLAEVELITLVTTLIKKLGFDGKSVINPRQIEPLHKVFMPSEKDLNKARAIMEAIADANARGSGVASLNGKMIDKPVVIRAKRLLELYEAGNKADEVEEL